MARPSTAGLIPQSSSGVWRSGTAPRSGTSVNNNASSIVKNDHDVVQGSLQRPATATNHREASRMQGMSLGSLLDGRNLGIASEPVEMDRYSTKSENLGSRMQQQNGRGQALEHVQGQNFRNTSLSGHQPTSTSQFPSHTPSSLAPGQGSRRPVNVGKVERPLTPSTLFLQNAIQSQNFSRQNQQQTRQEQQVKYYQ